MDLPGVFLLLCGVPLEPGNKLLGTVFGECAFLADAQDAVHNGFGDAKAEHGVRETGQRHGHRANEVRAGEHAVSQGVRGLAVFQTVHGDYVRHLHTGRAHHLAALAVQAELKRIIEELRVLQAIALAVRSRLLRAGIVRVNRMHRAHIRAEIALEAHLQVGRADIGFLHIPYFLAIISP